MICDNCSAEVTQNYCANCGQATLVKRIDGHYIVHEIEHVLHFEKGILYTVRELTIRPGQTIRRFITTDRNRLVKPIIFIIITSLIYTIITQSFHIEEGYIYFEKSKGKVETLIVRWIQNHYGYSNILIGMFVALWTKLLFRKYSYNFFEILIVLCFIMGISMLIFAFFAFLQGVTHFNMMSISGWVGIGYITWAIGQFFGENKISNYVKSLLAYVLGLLTFTLATLILGGVADLILRH